MNKTFRTFLRSVADTGSAPEAILVFLKLKGENVNPTTADGAEVRRRKVK